LLSDRLAAEGFDVELNRPYAGGFITEHYGRPARNVHAVQIEVNRGLYINEQTLEITEGFEPLRQRLTKVMADVFRAIGEAFHPWQAAAE
jgi:N-formylglutamate amidohydrolase